MKPTNLNSRNIADCVPELQEVDAWVKLEWDKRYPSDPNPVLVQTYRASAIQEVFYMQGRTDIDTLNSRRKELGLIALSVSDNKVITKKKDGGKHNCFPSEAVDYLFIEGRRILTDRESRPFFFKLHDLIKEKFPSVTWGADWNNDGKTEDEIFIDMPHFQV